MEKELLLKAFENADSFYMHKFRNVDRFTDACVSYVLWHRGFYRETTYTKEERLEHYWARVERYGGYVVKMVKNGTPIDEIIKIVENILNYLPSFVKTIIVEFITNYIKKLTEEIL